MYAKLYSAQTAATYASLVEIEISLTSGIAQLSIVGLPDKAVEESKDRVSSALENSNFEKSEDFKTLKSKMSKITISLAPANLQKSGPLFDLPIALAYLKATGELDYLPNDSIFVGELALDGRVQAINGAISVAKLAKDQGFKSIYLPSANAKEAALIDGIEVYGISSLSEAVEILRGEVRKEPEKEPDFLHRKEPPK